MDVVILVLFCFDGLSNLHLYFAFMDVAIHMFQLFLWYREFLRAGSDVMQAFTFYASEDKLINRGNYAGQKLGVDAINR